MIKLALLLLLLPTLSFASSFSGGSASQSVLGNQSRDNINIIVFMIDDIGREAFPQLNALWKDDGSDTFDDMDYGNRYPVLTASDLPNLTKLQENGITFDGMWSGTQCTPSRNLLRNGVFDPYDGSPQFSGTPKRRIQDQTGEAYKIYHYGKEIMGCSSNADNCGTEVNGPQNNYRTGSDSHGWLDGTVGGVFGETFQTYTNTDYTGVATDVPNDTELMAISGDYLQLQDEFGFEQGKDYIETLYASPMPQGIGDHWRGQPFIMTLGWHGVHASGGPICASVTSTATNGRVKPVADQVTAYQTAGSGRGAAGDSDAAPYGPETRVYSSSSTPTFANVTSDAGTGADFFKAYYDCHINSGLIWLDTKLGELIDWLGPEGLKQTLIIFTGDNGTESYSIPNRTGICPPATSGGAAVTHLLEDDSSEIGKCTIAGSEVTAVGKMTVSETGLNVPFVVGYGPIPEAVRGTTSKARLTFGDVAETVVQLIAPNSTGSGYYSEGRDFSPIILGTEADPDRPSGFGATVSMVDGTSVSAVLQPDASGDIYRMWRNYDGGSGVCDYIQNLADSNWYTNLRGSSDTEVVDAIDDLDTAITTAYSITEGGSSCDP